MSEMTLGRVLEALNPICRISVRRRDVYGLEYLGGGDKAAVIRRFGDCQIVDTWTMDGALVIYVV